MGHSPITLTNNYTGTALPTIVVYQDVSTQTAEYGTYDVTSYAAAYHDDLADMNALVSTINHCPLDHQVYFDWWYDETASGGVKPVTRFDYWVQ